jgi:hypothetical protein
MRVEAGGVLLEERVGHIVVGHRGGKLRGKLAISILSNMFAARKYSCCAIRLFLDRKFYRSRILDRKFYRAYYKYLRPP